MERCVCLCTEGARYPQGTIKATVLIETILAAFEMDEILYELRHLSATCLYTNTTDGHFLIAPHARHDEVLIVSACSGHGFKFASAIGEAVADLTMTFRGPTSHHSEGGVRLRIVDSGQIDDYLYLRCRSITNASNVLPRRSPIRGGSRFSRRSPTAAKSGASGCASNFRSHSRRCRITSRSWPAPDSSSHGERDSSCSTGFARMPSRII